MGIAWAKSLHKVRKVKMVNAWDSKWKIYLGSFYDFPENLRVYDEKHLWYETSEEKDARLQRQKDIRRDILALVILFALAILSLR